jgi:hypothetical protein
MSTQAQGASVRTQVVVEVPIERAFSVFTERFDSIKPREHNMLAVEIAERAGESTTVASMGASASGPACSPTSHRTA